MTTKAKVPNDPDNVKVVDPIQNMSLPELRGLRDSEPGRVDAEMARRARVAAGDEQAGRDAAEGHTIGDAAQAAQVAAMAEPAPDDEFTVDTDPDGSIEQASIKSERERRILEAGAAIDTERAAPIAAPVVEIAGDYDEHAEQEFADEQDRKFEAGEKQSPADQARAKIYYEGKPARDAARELAQAPARAATAAAAEAEREAYKAGAADREIERLAAIQQAEEKRDRENAEDEAENEAERVAAQKEIAPEFGNAQISVRYGAWDFAQDQFRRYGHATLGFFQDEFAEWDGHAYRVIDRTEIDAMIGRFFRISENPIGGRRATDELRAELAWACHIPNEQVIPFWRQSLIRPVPAELLATPPSECVAFQNLILHLPSGKTFEPTPHFFSFNALDFDYDPTATCTLWDKTLRDYWPDVAGNPADEVLLLQEICGYLLVPWSSLQRFFVLIGAGRNGKGVIVDVITALLGALNVVAMKSYDLGNPKRSNATLINKLLAVVTELGTGAKAQRATSTEFIKMVVGEGAVPISRRGKSEWSGKLSIRFLFSGNAIPAFTDSSRALRDRLVTLMFTRYFAEGERDITLFDKLKSELAGIFVWARAGYLRLKATERFTLPASSIELTDEIERAASGVLPFVQERCKIAADAVISEAAIYAAYKKWANAGHVRPIMSQGDFCRHAVMVPGIVRYRPAITGAARDLGHSAERALRGVKVIP